MSQRTRKRFDIATVLLLLVTAAMIVSMFLQVNKGADFDWDAAIEHVDLYYHNVYPECAFRGVEPEYTGECLYVNNRYEKDGRVYTLTDIYENVLVGSNVRHVRLVRIPENIHPNAFAGVEGVVVYADEEITEDMEWAKSVTIRSSEDFSKYIEPKTSYELVFTAEQLANFVKNWAGDEKVMLWYTVPAAVVMFLLAVLRQKTGHANPLWPVFRSGIGKGLFKFYSVVVGFVTALVLFCEEVDMDLDVYGVVEYMLGWPLTALAVIGGLFLLWDLFNKDFPWFIARWVVRITITLLIVLICAIIGWVVATIVTENLAMFKALYIIGLALFIGVIMGGGPNIERKAKEKMNPYLAIAEDGTSIRIDYYDYGTYVGKDQIVAIGEDTMTGQSGQIYKKH